MKCTESGKVPASPRRPRQGASSCHSQVYGTTVPQGHLPHQLYGPSGPSSSLKVSREASSWKGPKDHIIQSSFYQVKHPCDHPSRRLSRAGRHTAREGRWSRRSLPPSALPGQGL